MEAFALNILRNDGNEKSFLKNGWTSEKAENWFATEEELNKTDLYENEGAALISLAMFHNLVGEEIFAERYNGAEVIKMKPKSSSQNLRVQ